jgi:hypothetical protein
MIQQKASLEARVAAADESKQFAKGEKLRQRLNKLTTQNTKTWAKVERKIAEMTNPEPDAFDGPSFAKRQKNDEVGGCWGRGDNTKLDHKNVFYTVCFLNLSCSMLVCVQRATLCAHTQSQHPLTHTPHAQMVELINSVFYPPAVVVKDDDEDEDDY